MKYNLELGLSLEEKPYTQKKHHVSSDFSVGIVVMCATVMIQLSKVTSDNNYDYISLII